MGYKLVVDSCCELISELDSLNALSVPLKMTLGEQTFIDDKNLDVNDFIEKMNNYKGKAMSSCPSPQEYNEAFDKDKTNFVVTISSQLSGSYASANVAKSLAEEDGTDVHVFDSRSASAGELLISLKIKELVDKGLDKSDIIKKAQEFVDQMKTFFVLENLDNLMKNGRMTKIVAKIATVMQIRPILGADEKGDIAMYSKARGTQNAITKLVETIGEHCKDTKDKILAITHCNNEVQALRVKKLAKEKYSFKDIFIVKTGGLSSMYANEGGVIIAF